MDEVEDDEFDDNEEGISPFEKKKKQLLAAEQVNIDDFNDLLRYAQRKRESHCLPALTKVYFSQLDQFTLISYLTPNLHTLRLQKLLKQRDDKKNLDIIKSNCAVLKDISSL